MRIIDLSHRFQQPLDHQPLVEHRQLNRHRRQLVELPLRGGDEFLSVLIKAADGFEAVKTIDGKDDQAGEVRDEQRVIKPVQLVNPGEGRIQQLPHDPFSRGGSQKKCK